MNTRLAMVMTCVCVALLVGCGRINRARLNSDMTNQQISEQVSKQLRTGMTVEEVQSREKWFRFAQSEKMGLRSITLDPEWQSRSEIQGFLARSSPPAFSSGRVLEPPSHATITTQCIAWRLENSGFVWEFMTRYSEECVYAVFDTEGRLGAVYRTEMDGINGTDVLRRIPLTPEPAP
jgi:hypothetical protein